MSEVRYEYGAGAYYTCERGHKQDILQLQLIEKSSNDLLAIADLSLVESSVLMNTQQVSADLANFLVQSSIPAIWHGGITSFSTGAGEIIWNIVDTHLINDAYPYRLVKDGATKTGWTSQQVRRRAEEGKVNIVYEDIFNEVPCFVLSFN